MIVSSRLRLRLVAGACLFVLSSGASAERVASIEGVDAAVLSGVPVEIVVLNDRLRAQIAYQSVSVDPSVTMNAMQGIPGMNTYGGAAAGALGGALATAIMNEAAQADAEEFARPAWELLGDAQCHLRTSEALATELEAAVHASPWGAPVPVTRTVLVGPQGAELPKGKGQARYLLAASYSLDPQFGTLATTLTASLYSNAVSEAPKRWQTHASRRDDLVVISAPVEIGPPTEADIAFLDQFQRARHAALLKRLAAKANKGNWDAREEYEREKRWDPKPLRTPAQVTAWEPDELALLRARRWAADDCSALRAAVAANQAELARMLAALWRGELRDGEVVGIADPAAGPATPLGRRGAPYFTSLMATTSEPIASGATRRIWKRAEKPVISVRDAESMVTPVAFLHSWLPLKKSEL